MSPLEPDKDYQSFPKYSIDKKCFNESQKTTEINWAHWNNLLFRKGLSESDYKTLRLSKRLLTQIFQAPEEPEKPYWAIPVLAPLLAWFAKRREPERFAKSNQRYQWQLERREQVSDREACVRVRIWHQLVQFRGAHLQSRIQRQLEHSIETTLLKNPERSLIRTRLITDMVSLGHLVFKREPV